MRRLPAATAPPETGRIERKHTLPPLDGGAAIAFVRARIPGLGVEHPPRRVSSLYFDTAGYACYAQSSAGASDRVKLRLRWYGPLEPATRPVLEIKYRAGPLGWKSQYPLDAFDLAATPLRGLPRRFALEVTSRERPLVELLRCPVLVTSYWRHYLVTADGRIRVTVDTDLRYFDQRAGPRLRLRSHGRRAEVAIVECKLPAADESGAGRLVRALARPRRFSKYCHGLALLAEDPDAAPA